MSEAAVLTARSAALAVGSGTTASTLRRMTRLGAMVSLVGLCTASIEASAQGLPPALIDELGGFVADRVESLIIFGGDNGLTGGAYAFSGSATADIAITKVGGSGTIGDPRPLGEGRLRWAPILKGTVGYVQGENRFRQRVLGGNLSTYETFGVGLGGGARVYLSDLVSVGTAIGVIYGRTSNEFTAGTPLGVAVQQLVGGLLVDWTANSMTLTPTLDLQLDWKIGRVGLEFVSDYRPFITWSFGESSPAIELDGASHVWINKIDVDVPLGIRVLGRGLRTGGFFGHAELFGDISRALQARYINTANARLVADTAGALPWTRWIGVGGSYFWGPNVDGYSIGIDVRMDF